MYDILETLTGNVETVIGGGLIVLALTIIVAISAEIGRRRVLRNAEESEDRDGIYAAIDVERDYQDDRWGTAFDDLNTSNDWCSYICRYATNAASFNASPAHFREQMVKVAALAVAAIEATDRNMGLPKRHYD